MENTIKVNEKKLEKIIRENIERMTATPIEYQSIIRQAYVEKEENLKLQMESVESALELLPQLVEMIADEYVIAGINAVVHELRFYSEWNEMNIGYKFTSKEENVNQETIEKILDDLSNDSTFKLKYGKIIKNIYLDNFIDGYFKVGVEVFHYASPYVPEK